MIYSRGIQPSDTVTWLPSTNVLCATFSVIIGHASNSTQSRKDYMKILTTLRERLEHKEFGMGRCWIENFIGNIQGKLHWECFFDPFVYSLETERTRVRKTWMKIEDWHPGAQSGAARTLLKESLQHIVLGMFSPRGKGCLCWTCKNLNTIDSLPTGQADRSERVYVWVGASLALESCFPFSSVVGGVPWKPSTVLYIVDHLPYLQGNNFPLCKAINMLSTTIGSLHALLLTLTVLRRFLKLQLL